VRKVFNILLSLVILGALFYQFRDFVFPPKPCTEPIPYALGTFDERFDVSEEYFLQALAEAETVWEKAIDRDLFAYAPENSDPEVLKINLVYDYRQQATEKLSDLGSSVQNNQASYDLLRVKFETLKAEYEQKQEEFDARLKAWNRTPRTDQKEYRELRALQSDLNETAEEVNALVAELNRLARTLNISVDKYNTVSTSRGETFEEGVYVSDVLGRKIDIYEWGSRAELVRLLAHELGHALNIEHVADPKAIMYQLNQGENTTLTGADMEALKIVCELVL
jgi:predicted Zn-dependent protease